MIRFAISFGVIYSLCNLFFEIDINPLFTFTKWLKNNNSSYKMISTIFMQVLGAVEAGLLIHLMLPSLTDALVIGVGDYILFSADFNTIVVTDDLFKFLKKYNINVYFIIPNEELTSYDSNNIRQILILFFNTAKAFVFLFVLKI